MSEKFRKRTIFFRGGPYKSKVSKQERVEERRVKPDREGDRKEKEGWLESELPASEREKEKEREE